MSILRHILLLPVYLWCLGYMAIGATVPLEWDAVPEAASYRIFRGIEVVGISDSNRATVELPGDQWSVLTVTAVNLAGESAHSKSLTLRPVIITVESSDDLSEWRDVSRVIRLESAPAKNYRAKIETP